MTARTRGQRDYSERLVKGHMVGVERLEPQRWRVTVDGRRLFTFCSESRARQAGVLEAGRLAFRVGDALGGGLAADVPVHPPANGPADRSRRSR